MRLFTTIVAVSCIAALSPLVSAQRIYVDVGVANAGKGKSWKTAYKGLRPALQNATSGTEIWMAKGTYAGAPYAVPARVKVFGGFESGDTQFSQRYPIVNVTILDGQDQNRVLTAGNGAVIDGVIVQRGRAKGQGGGGMLVVGKSPTLFVIYALLAIPLQSYLQPLVIMSVIPFGMVGAILGHYVMGLDLVFFSLLGIVALSGVVVNSSLILVDYINRQRQYGQDLYWAVSHAGSVRFRPIVLTSATTFVGLTPMMALSNMSTIMFVPMATSLAFGVLMGTLITLFLVPSLYLILEDLLTLTGRGRSTAKSSDRMATEVPENS